MNKPPLHVGHLDRVRLRVRSVETMASFYVDVLGLERRGGRDDGAVLSPPERGAAPAFRLVLTADPEAVPTSGPSVGLYHFALLYPDRTSLAGAVLSVLESGWERIDGASDHGVSEAFYLRDPEGNGVELYRDRSRERWPERDGEVAMTTERLDVDELLSEAAGGGALRSPGLGHVHLHVSDLERSRDFYVGILGLRIRQSSYPGALFLAAGAYHHHLGLNTWARGRTAPSGAAGLLDYRWRMPAQRIEEIRERARKEGIELREAAGGVSLRDPDGIEVIVGPRDRDSGSPFPESPPGLSGTSPGSGPGTGDGDGGAPSP